MQNEISSVTEDVDLDIKEIEEKTIFEVQTKNYLLGSSLSLNTLNCVGAAAIECGGRI